MLDFRVFCDATCVGDGFIALSQEESLHLVASNRARKGDPVKAFDGTGLEWDTILEIADKRRARLRIHKEHRVSPAKTNIALAQALPKGKLFESIIKKSVELGIQSVHPIVTSHVELKLKVDRAKTRSDKWRIAAIEGSKQSGNPFLPQIGTPRTLDRFLQESRDYQLRLVASLRPEAISLKRCLEKHRKANRGLNPLSAVFLVGPEGDFSEEELRGLDAEGFIPITLGPYVMRCETAAVAALSRLCGELG